MPVEASSRARSNAVSDVLQRALDATVNPVRIVRCHADDVRVDLFHDPRSALVLLRVGPLRSDEFPVPSDQGVGRDDRSNTTQDLPAE